VKKLPKQASGAACVGRTAFKSRLRGLLATIGGAKLLEDRSEPGLSRALRPGRSASCTQRPTALRATPLLGSGAASDLFPTSAELVPDSYPTEDSNARRRGDPAGRAANALQVRRRRGN
jgi:hypothetical protein